MRCNGRNSSLPTCSIEYITYDAPKWSSTSLQWYFACALSQLGPPRYQVRLLVQLREKQLKLISVCLRVCRPARIHPEPKQSRSGVQRRLHRNRVLQHLRRYSSGHYIRSSLLFRPVLAWAKREQIGTPGLEDVCGHRVCYGFCRRYSNDCMQ